MGYKSSPSLSSVLQPRTNYLSKTWVPPLWNIIIKKDRAEGYLWILFIASFTVQKLLSLIRYTLFIFIFISITLGDGSKKILLWFIKCQNVLPMFSFKSFIVSGLTSKSLIHFIFVYGVRKHSSFILLHRAVPFSQHHLLKRLSFLHCIFLPPLLKISCP